MFLFLLMGHAMLTFTFWYSNYSNVIRAVWMLAPFVSIWMIKWLSPHDNAFTLDALMGLLLFMSLLRVFHWLILIIATLVMRCTGGKKHEKRYKKLVGNLFFLLLQYHEHLYSAIIVCTAQSIAMFAIMLLWWVHGWMMRFYQWSVVKSASDQLGISQSRVK